MKKDFKDLGIVSPILKAIDEIGFQEPTEVQSRVIPHILDSKDLIVISKTGSGKTAAFGIPILQMTDPRAVKPQALILTPTRELAVQIDKDLQKMSKHLHHHTTAVYGQHSMGVEIPVLKKGVSVVTGTPGRVYDHISQRHLITSDIRFLVLDEADRMLDMGFIGQVERIIRTLPKDRLTLLFSATIPDEVRSICRKYMKHPVTIELESDTKTVDTIEQVYYRVNQNEKNTQLHRILIMEQPESCIIFCNTRRAVDRVQSYLSRKGYAVQALHGDIPQGKRLKTMQQFKQREFRLLVATDVAARGIHIDDLALVINYDVPLEKDNYIHRVGRTGRAGQKGRAISLVTGDDLMDLYEIEAHIGVLIEEQEFPSEAVFNEYLAQAQKWIQENSRKTIPSRAGHQSASGPTRRKASSTGSRQDPRKPRTRHQTSPNDRVTKEGSSSRSTEQVKPVRAPVTSTVLASPPPDQTSFKKSPMASPPQKQKQTAKVPFLLRLLQRITGK